MHNAENPCIFLALLNFLRLPQDYLRLQQSFTSPISSTTLCLPPEFGVLWRRSLQERSWFPSKKPRAQRLMGMATFLFNIWVNSDSTYYFFFLAFLQCNYLENRTMYSTKNIWKQRLSNKNIIGLDFKGMHAAIIPGCIKLQNWEKLWPRYFFSWNIFHFKSLLFSFFFMAHFVMKGALFCW